MATTRTGELRERWRVLLASALGAGGGISGIHYYTIGLFIAPISAAFDVSRGKASSFGFFGTLIGLALAIPFGMLVDRFGSRRIALIGSPLFAVALACMGLYDGAFAGFFALTMVMYVVAHGTSPIVYTRMVSRNFSRALGFGLGLTLASLGLMGVVMPPILARVMHGNGWQSGYLVLAAVALLVWPLLFAFLRDDPRATRSPEPAERPRHDGLSKRAALTRPLFVCMGLLFFATALGVAAVMVQFVPILEDRGVDPVVAGTAVSLVAVGIVTGRLCVGFFVDRIFAPRVAAAVFGITICGMALLLTGVPALAFVAAPLLGVGFGAEGDLVAYLVTRYFGTASYATLYAGAYAFFTVGANLGPLLTGMAFDWTGTYTLAIVGAMVLLAVAVCATFAFPRFATAQPAGEPGLENAASRREDR